jgi:hypothetical protein
MIMAYDPRKPYLSGEQYIHNPDYLSSALAEKVKKDVRTLCSALGYDINTVEFAIKDGVPYAIDFMNPAPDAELASVGEFYHNWIVDAVTDLVFRRLETSREQPRYRWDSFLNPELTSTSAVASVAEQQSRTIQPSAKPIKVEQATAAVASAGDTATTRESRRTKTESAPVTRKRGNSSPRPRKTV